MKKNTTQLNFQSNNRLQTQTKMEALMNTAGMVVAKFVFWIIIFLSITVEINGQSLTIAEDDINQTPIGVAVLGNILTNDSDPSNEEQWVKSVTFFDELGNEHLGQISGRAFSVWARNGVFAGSISFYMDGNYEFNPFPTFKGELVIYYEVENTSGATAAATLTIQVIPRNNPIRNDRPIAHNDTNTTEMGMEVEGNVITSNDFDIEGDALTIHAVFADVDGNGLRDEPLTIGVGAVVYGKDNLDNPVMAGMLILNSDGTYLFDPLAEFSGKLSVKYQVTDGFSSVAQANLTILVIPQNGHQCFANDDIIIGKKNRVQNGNLLTNDHILTEDLQNIVSGKNNHGLSLIIDGVTENELRSNGTVVIDTDGSFTYSPRPAFIGTESITYVICGNTGSEITCDTATLYLTTIPFNGLGNSGISNSNSSASSRNLIGSELKVGKNNLEAKELSLYPNPGIVGDGFINLAFKSTTGEAHIQISDMTGRIVRRLLVDANTKEMNNLEMNVADLIEGKYFLQLIDGKNSYAEMFILIDKN